jgi:hypothetical protein
MELTSDVRGRAVGGEVVLDLAGGSLVTEAAQLFTIDGRLSLVDGGPSSQVHYGFFFQSLSFVCVCVCVCVWRAGDQSGIEVGAGGVLQQQGELQVRVRAFLADGVRLASGASWLQLGSATISAGQAGHDRDFSLSTRPPLQSLHHCVATSSSTANNTPCFCFLISSSVQQQQTTVCWWRPMRRGTRQAR